MAMPIILRSLFCAVLCVCLVACSTTRTLTPQYALGGRANVEVGDTVTLGLKNGQQQTLVVVTQINKARIVGRTPTGELVTVTEAEIAYVMHPEISGAKTTLLIVGIVGAVAALVLTISSALEDIDL